MGSTVDLAKYATSLEPGSLPNRAIDDAKAVLADHLGVALHGSSQPWSRIVAEQTIAESGDGRGRVPLIGRREHLLGSAAARVNGTASHSFELDDVFEAGAIHPGAVVIPAAVAAAIEREVSGEQLLGAIVVGYEVLGRIALAAASQSTPFHTTGTHGVLGATAAVASLAGFNAEELANALGVAASYSGGLKAFQSSGGDIKRLHPGKSAEAAIKVVDLCERGFTGPKDVLENKRGFFAAYGGSNGSVDQLALGPADDFVISNVCFKQYSNCAATHTAVKAVSDMKKAHGLLPDQVAHVVVGTSRRGMDQNSISIPTDTMSVQYSIESAVALALLGMEQDPTMFTYERYTRSGAPELTSLVKVVLDEEVDAVYPGRMAARVEVELNDGTTYQTYEAGIADAKEGTGAWGIVETKFRRLTKDLLTSDAQEEILSGVKGLSEDGSVLEIMEMVGEGYVIARSTTS